MSGDKDRDETEKLAAACAAFFDNPKDAKPDVAALAAFLRNEQLPLPEGFRSALAEILDSRLRGELACWQLRPHRSPNQNVG